MKSKYDAIFETMDEKEAAEKISRLWFRRNALRRGRQSLHHALWQRHGGGAVTRRNNPARD